MDEATQSFCALAGADAGESTYGSAAARTDAWIGLEVPAAWAAKAWESAEISAELRAHVDGFVERTDGARIQLIKPVHAEARRERTVILASTRQGRAAVTEIHVDALDDLRAWDLDAAMAELRAGRLPAGTRAPTRPIAWVCTNGKRDRCCAKWGLPVAEALAAEPTVATWQTTHLGGHRFAATLLWLPDGLCFGRLTADEIPDFVAAARSRRIARIERLRGRTAHGEAEQAAECLVREREGILGFDDVEVISSHDDGDVTHVTLRVEGGGRTVVVAREAVGTTAPPSCGKPLEPVMRWRLAHEPRVESR